MATFSILSRIEASAACTGETYDVTVMSLSVSSVGSKPLPQGWSPHLLAAGRVFQYPQSDRSLCRLGIDPRTWRAFDFQYPQSDRSLCREAPTTHEHLNGRLSVSSVGSKPLPRTVYWIISTMRSRLSVSSVGSKPLPPTWRGIWTQ